MNKNITLLMLVSLFALSMASETTATPIVARSIMGWVMNSWDFLMVFNTVLYCFTIGQYNVFYLNDGGASLYQCVNALVKNVAWTE